MLQPLIESLYTKQKGRKWLGPGDKKKIQAKAEEKKNRFMEDM